MAIGLERINRCRLRRNRIVEVTGLAIIPVAHRYRGRGLPLYADLVGVETPLPAMHVPELWSPPNRAL